MTEVEKNPESSSPATPQAQPAIPPAPSTRWLHPWREMEREFERFFNRPLSMTPREWPRLDEWFRAAELELPAMDVIDRDAEVVVRAQVPGMTAEDLDVTLTDQSLTVRGHQRSETEENGEFHRREISSREFIRTIELPAAVDAEKAKATCKDGLLEITVPKREVARKQKLTIEST
jgi:HSP20 family protein